MIVRFLLENVSLPKITPRVCGHRQCPPGWHIERQGQRGYNIHYVFKGNGVFTKNGINHNVSAGDLFICHPGDSISYTASMTDPWDYAWVAFGSAADLDNLLTKDVFHVTAANQIFTQMIAARNEPAKEWIVGSLIYQLLALLAETQNQSSADKGYLSRAVAYIEENHTHNIQVAHIADMLGLNRSYFCRVFKQHIGMSPQEYIVAYRLEQVEKLLIGTKMTQKEIALQVGYPDVYALSRMFKRRYGIAPGKFRKNHMQNK